MGVKLNYKFAKHTYLRCFTRLFRALIDLAYLFLHNDFQQAKDVIGTAIFSILRPAICVVGRAGHVMN